MKKLFLLLVSYSIAFGSSFDENLILHLEMDLMDDTKTMLDSSPYQSDTKGHGDVSLVADRNDINSSALKFGGTNSFVISFLPNDLLEKEATISFWAKIESEDKSPLFYIGDRTKHGASSVYLDGSSFIPHKGNNTGLGASWTTILSNHTEWNFYTITFSDLKTCVYVNGTLKDLFKSRNGHKLFDPYYLYIGYSPFLNSNGSNLSYFKGVVDDFRIYNKSLSSLNVIELKSSYNNLIDLSQEKLSFTELLEKVANLEEALEKSRRHNYRLNDLISLYKEEVSSLTSYSNTPFINGWIYDENNGWLFTNYEFYPLVYSNKNSSWYYYELGSHSPRHFYSYKTKQWESWDE